MDNETVSQPGKPRRAATAKVFKAWFPRLLEFGAVALVTGVLINYLVGPQVKSWCQATELSVKQRPETPVHKYLLDCFIVTDASKSPRDRESYESIEAMLRKNLSLAAGDRISYLAFGTGTVPNPIQPPSADEGSLERQRQRASHVQFDTTDFKLLFNQLAETIRADRNAQVITRRPAHADAVIILSDGIPDLSTRRNGCPQERQTLISPEIVGAFRDLIKGPYATQEPIIVRLILVGTPEDCDPIIKQEWETKLNSIAGPTNFEVLSYSELGPNLENQLLPRLRRHPRIILQLDDIEDQDRDALDRGQKFAVGYTAWSFRQGGTLTVEGAWLKRGLEQNSEEGPGQQLQVFQTSDQKAAWHRPTISVPSPENPQASFLGGPVDGELYFRPVNGSSAIDEDATYFLKLEFPPNTAVEMKPADFLKASPCNRSGERKATRARLKTLSLLPAAIGILYFLGTLTWHLTSRRNRLHWFTEKLFVRPWARWLEALLVLLIPMTAGIYCLQKPLFFAVCVGLILSLLLFFLEQVRKSPTIHLLFFTLEFLFLPFIVEGAANHMF